MSAQTSILIRAISLLYVIKQMVPPKWDRRMGIIGFHKTNPHLSARVIPVPAEAFPTFIETKWDQFGGANLITDALD